ncbi:hypothetical protein BJV77DRAFT_963516 [Russula vinacea]|nr:hypothetical protein BJV77DRAFT_963516 [Russula vinacea]
MSTVPSTSASHSNFVSIFNVALETYKRKTKNDLASHPLLPSLQSCDSPEAILTVLREQIPAFSQSQNDDDRLTNGSRRPHSLQRLRYLRELVFSLCILTRMAPRRPKMPVPAKKS